MKMLKMYKTWVAVITMVPCQSSFICSFVTASYRKVRECEVSVACRGITFVSGFMYVCPVVFELTRRQMTHRHVVTSIHFFYAPHAKNT